ncbi:MAG: hypothetical protein ACI4F4_07255 [Lachnospiraceae bacterium]
MSQAKKIGVKCGICGILFILMIAGTVVVFLNNKEVSVPCEEVEVTVVSASREMKRVKGHTRGVEEVVVEYEGKHYELQTLNDPKVNECIAAKDNNQRVMVYYADGQMHAGIPTVPANPKLKALFYLMMVIDFILCIVFFTYAVDYSNLKNAEAKKGEEQKKVAEL